jgi:branched-chain amino acid transport system ATP-binding protein
MPMTDTPKKTPLASLTNVDVFYGPVQALFGVNVTVMPGETVVVLGGNASGKSTTVKTLLGLVKVASGEVVFDGESVNNRPAYQMIERGIGSIPEGRRMFSEMTVLENLKLGAFVRRGEPKAVLDAQIEEAMVMFPRLAERRNQISGTMSGGEQQMLAMARAWMRKPKLLCIDEPSMGLSPLFVDHVYEILSRWKAQGLTILMVEQNANMALSIADHGYVLRQGHVSVAGTAAELRDNDEVRRAYLGG